jgi:hypothetical protein
MPIASTEHELTVISKKILEHLKYFRLLYFFDAEIYGSKPSISALFLSSKKRESESESDRERQREDERERDKEKERERERKLQGGAGRGERAREQTDHLHVSQFAGGLRCDTIQLL